MSATPAPQADAWLGAKSPDPRLVFLGAPTSALSISPSQAELTPAAFRRMLRRFPVWDAEHGVDIDSVACLDRGDVTMGGEPIGARRRLESEVAVAATSIAARLRAGEGALALCGGDNSITYAGVRGMAQALGVELDSGRVGLLTFDAHHDLRAAHPHPSNGSPVGELLRDGLPGNCVAQVGISAFGNQRQLAERAADAGIAVFHVADTRQRGWTAVATEALARIKADYIYLDVDFDVLDRAFAPACPASLPGGAAPAEVAAAAHVAGMDGRVVALDMVEVDCAADIAGTTLRAMGLVFLSFVSGVARRGGVTGG
jgi:arginase family enzyme